MRIFISFLNWHAYPFTGTHTRMCTHTPRTHKHIYFNSSWIITVFKLCIVILNTQRTKKKAHLICEHFRGCSTEGLFFTKLCILIHTYHVKFKRLQTANAEVLHMQCKQLNLQKYQNWQKELQGKIYLTKLKRFLCCGKM